MYKCGLDIADLGLHLILLLRQGFILWDPNNRCLIDSDSWLIMIKKKKIMLQTIFNHNKRDYQLTHDVGGKDLLKRAGAQFLSGADYCF